MLGEVDEGVYVLIGGVVLTVAEGDVVLARERLDPLEQLLGQGGHVRIGDRGVKW